MNIKEIRKARDKAFASVEILASVKDKDERTSIAFEALNTVIRELDGAIIDKQKKAITNTIEYLGGDYGNSSYYEIGLEIDNGEKEIEEAIKELIILINREITEAIDSNDIGQLKELYKHANNLLEII